jgi:hypothetical protein
MSRATEDRINLLVPCRYIEARPNGTVTISVDGPQLTFWNHEPERPEEAAGKSGGRMEYQPRWGLLWVPSNDDRYAFSVAGPFTDSVPCPLESRVRSPEELLDCAGGLLISVKSLRRRRRGEICQETM